MCKHSTDRIFCPILIKFGTNVPFANISAKFENRPNRSNQSALLGVQNPKNGGFLVKKCIYGPILMKLGINGSFANILTE